LIRVTVTNSWKSELTYDGKFRRRIRKEFAWQNSTWAPTSEVHYICDGNLVIQERDGKNLATVTYSRGRDLSASLEGAGGIGGLLARTANSQLPSPNAHAYYHADGNGNTTAMVNAQQMLVAKYIYDPFGNTLSKSGPLADANTYRFSSQEYHQNSGLLLYLRRAYDSNLQRWLNGDPIEERGGIDLYAYVGNNPISQNDPLGLSGNPVSSTIPGIGGSWPSNPYAPGGTYYIPPAPRPLFPVPFGGGVIASGTLEAGDAFGAGGNLSAGGGFFYNPNEGFSVGGFDSGGAFLGGPSGSLNAPGSPTDRPSGIFGATAGVGSGLWVSNAGSPSDLGGPFDQWNLNFPFASLCFAKSGGTWIGSLVLGRSEGASFSIYPTSTFAAGGFNLLSGQPIVYPSPSK